MAAPQTPAPRRGSGMEVDWNEVPDTSSLLSGTYNVRIMKCFESTTGGGKACWKAELKVIPHNATKLMNNRVHINTFTIGSDDDPLAQISDTIKGAFGTRDMKHMFKAAKVKLEKRIGLTARASIGKPLTIIGVLPKKPAKGQNRVFFNITEWLPLGKKEPCIDVETVDDEAIAASNGRPRRGAPAAEPETEEESELEAGADAEETTEEVAEPSDESSDEPAGDEEEAEADPEAEAADPEAEEEPVKTTKAKAKGTKEATVKCGMCEKEIPRSLYKTHVPKCNG